MNRNKTKIFLHISIPILTMIIGYVGAHISNYFDTKNLIHDFGACLQDVQTYKVIMSIHEYSCDCTDYTKKLHERLHNAIDNRETL